MMNVEQVLRHKGREVHTVTAAASVRSALQVLCAHNIGALVVRDGARVVGILSERDLVRRVMQRERSLDETFVRTVMTSPVVTARPNDTLDHCMSVMTEQRVRHLPVLDQGELCGLVSVGDVVKAKLAEQAGAIADLERYISTPYGVPALDGAELLAQR
jgi:CBS domain-containing protein